MKSVARQGLVECVNHELLHPYPVLAEKNGDFVAQFKYTIATGKEGPVLICGSHNVDVSKYKSDYKISDEEILKTLSV